MIFAVDDSEMDAELLLMTLQRAGVPHPVTPFVNGDDVVKALSQRAMALQALPLVCLLDIKMPGLSGLQLLEWIRNDSHFDSMAVVMVTSSNHPDDVDAADRLGAQCYLLKFPKPEELRAVITSAEAYAAEPNPRAKFELGCNQMLGT